MDNINVRTIRIDNLATFLELNHFSIESLTDGVYKVTRENELPVFITCNNNTLYFEVDLGNISKIATKDLYFQLLDLNTEILPVSFGINNTNPDDPRLVLVESREIGDLSNHEVLSVFDAIELAVDKAETILSHLI